jgi:hypothetical protein
MRIAVYCLGHLQERAIAERKLENEVSQLIGVGIPITGFDAPQVFADTLEISQTFGRDSYDAPEL